MGSLIQNPPDLWRDEILEFARNEAPLLVNRYSDYCFARNFNTNYFGFVATDIAIGYCLWNQPLKQLATKHIMNNRSALQHFLFSLFLEVFVSLWRILLRVLNILLKKY